MQRCRNNTFRFIYRNHRSWLSASSSPIVIVFYAFLLVTIERIQICSTLYLPNQGGNINDNDNRTSTTASSSICKSKIYKGIDKFTHHFQVNWFYVAAIGVLVWKLKPAHRVYPPPLPRIDRLPLHVTPQTIGLFEPLMFVAKMAVLTIAITLVVTFLFVMCLTKFFKKQNSQARWPPSMDNPQRGNPYTSNTYSTPITPISPAATHNANPYFKRT